MARVHNSVEDEMAVQHSLKLQSDLTQALTRLDVMESKVSLLEESVNKAVATLMPKVDSLLSGRTLDHSAGCTSSISSAHSPLPKSVLELAEQGDGEALLQLLAAEEIDIQSDSQRTDDNNTGLHVAASGGHLKAVVVLLGAGAKVNAPGHRLRTPLHCAAAQGHLGVAQRLLVAGAKVDVKDTNGVTPLDLAAGQGHRELVHLLLQKGAQPNENSVSLAAESGNWNFVELFLQCGGALLNARNKEGHPVIVLSAKGNRWAIVELLLKKGASAITCKDPKESALVYASKSGKADVVRKLLDHGAAGNDVQVKFALLEAKNAAVVWAFAEAVPQHVRGTPGILGLLSSAMDGRKNSLIAFLEAGVDVNGRDTPNVFIVPCVILSEETNCVREFWAGGQNTPLHAASMNGHVECVRALLDAGASTTWVNNEGKTPLDVAASDAVRAAFNRK